MNEALVALHEGKRVRRTVWHKELCVELYCVYRLTNPTINKSLEYKFTPDDIQANDWEYYNEQG